MYWYLQVFKKYATFTGRARRKEYWMYTLFNTLFLIITMVPDNLLNLTIADLPYGLFYVLYTLAVLIPGLAVSVRRLHDIGKSGWMLFIAFIPIAGAIWLLVLMCTDSQEEENEYGPNPKIETPENTFQKGSLEINQENTNNKILLGVGIWILGTNTIIPLITTLLMRLGNYQLALIPGSIFYIIGSAVPLILSIAVKQKKTKKALLILGIINIAIVLVGQTIKIWHLAGRI